MEKQTAITVGAVAVVAVVAVLIVKKAASSLGGAITGNNDLTKNATNAAGDIVTAYQGAGILGTLGAATNAASGGVLASIGQTIGGAVYDLTHATVNPASGTTSAPGTSTSAPTAQYDAMGNYIGTY